MSNYDENIKFEYDQGSNTYYQDVKGYYFCINTTANNQKILSVSVSKDGTYPNSAQIKQDFKKVKEVVNVANQGYRLNFYFKIGMTKKKTDMYVQEGLNYIIDYLRENNYQNCCEVCGRSDGVGIYCVSGIPRILCDEDYGKATNELVYRKQQENNKKENVVTGTLGAVLGSLIGAAVMVVFGQLGYIVTLSGIIMGICAVKGYELLGNKLTKRGIIISVIVIILMTYIANRLDWAISVAREFDVDVLYSFSDLDYILEYLEIKGSFYTDLGMRLLFTLVGAIPLAIGTLKQKQIENESYVIMPAKTIEVIDNYNEEVGE